MVRSVDQDGHFFTVSQRSATISEQFATHIPTLRKILKAVKLDLHKKGFVYSKVKVTVTFVIPDKVLLTLKPLKVGGSHLDPLILIPKGHVNTTMLD